MVRKYGWVLVSKDDRFASHLGKLGKVWNTRSEARGFQRAYPKLQRCPYIRKILVTYEFVR